MWGNRRDCPSIETMKTNHDSYTKYEAADRDTIIGSALSNAMANVLTVDTCPSVEQLSVLVDGHATEEGRDNLLSHMAVCDRCREVYLLAHDLSLEEPGYQNKRGWYLAGGALAAVVLIVLAVKLTIQEPSISGQQVAQIPIQHQIATQIPTNAPNPPMKTIQQTQSKDIAFSTSKAARQLAKVASADSLAAAIGVPASGSYGFAGASRQSTAFRAGKELFELELWLAAGDRERAELAGERLASLIKSLSGDAATAPINDLLRQLETDGTPGKMEDITSQLETLLKTSDRGFVRLGAWATSVKVASGVGKDSFFSGYPPHLILDELEKDLSPVARDVLRKMDKRRPGNDTVELRRLLDDLANAI